MFNKNLAIQYLNGIEEFINHNVDLGNLRTDSTVGDVLSLVKYTKESYIPRCEAIEKMYDINNMKPDKYINRDITEPDIDMDLVKWK